MNGPINPRRVAFVSWMKDQDTNASRVAKASGVPYSTLASFVQGDTFSLKGTNEAKIAAAFSTTVDAIFLDASVSDAPRGYPRIGKVGAGGQGMYEDDYALGAAADYIDPLPGMPFDERIIVLDVEGDSMVPAVFDGDLAFFGPLRHDLDQLLNKRVMARLADGRKFFKILKRGSRDGRYTLRSLNPAFPDIEDVEVEWVLPYCGSRPAD